MWIADAMRKPAIHVPALMAGRSTRIQGRMPTMNGIITTIDQYGTPTFLPQALQVAGAAGPSHILRIHDMPG